jgi:hypothetical protein
MRIAIGTAVCLLAGAAGAQTMTYFWTVTTDDGDTDVQPGETAYLSLWAHMEPEETGFAGSIYDILGIRDWDTGEVVQHWNHLQDIPNNGILQANNDILNIETFQLPEAFNPTFDSNNPVELFTIWWATDDYVPREIEVGDADHLNNDVYTDEFGTSVSYKGVPGVARFTVNIPAPGALALLGLAAVRRARR